jgi:hypothetical protein
MLDPHFRIRGEGEEWEESEEEKREKKLFVKSLLKPFTVRESKVDSS